MPETGPSNLSRSLLFLESPSFSREGLCACPAPRHHRYLQLKTHLTVQGPSNLTALPFWGQKPRASSPALLPKRGTPRLLGKRTRESHQSFSCQPEPPGLELSFLPTPLCTQGAKFPLGSWKAGPAISFVLTVLSLSVTSSLFKDPWVLLVVFSEGGQWMLFFPKSSSFHCAPKTH